MVPCCFQACHGVQAAPTLAAASMPHQRPRVQQCQRREQGTGQAVSVWANATPLMQKWSYESRLRFVHRDVRSNRSYSILQNSHHNTKVHNLCYSALWLFLQGFAAVANARSSARQHLPWLRFKASGALAQFSCTPTISYQETNILQRNSQLGRPRPVAGCIQYTSIPRYLYCLWQAYTKVMALAKCTIITSLGMCGDSTSDHMQQKTGTQEALATV